MIHFSLAHARSSPSSRSPYRMGDSSRCRSRIPSRTASATTFSRDVPRTRGADVAWNHSGRQSNLGVSVPQSNPTVEEAIGIIEGLLPVQNAAGHLISTLEAEEIAHQRHQMLASLVDVLAFDPLSLPATRPAFRCHSTSRDDVVNMASIGQLRFGERSSFCHLKSSSLLTFTVFSRIGSYPVATSLSTKKLPST